MALNCTYFIVETVNCIRSLGFSSIVGTYILSCCYAALSSATTRGFFPFECAFSGDGLIHRSVGQILVTLLFPFMVIVLFTISWTLLWNVKGRPALYLQDRLYISVLSVLYVFYISTTENVVKVFDCTSVGNDCKIQSTAMKCVTSTSDYWVIDTDVRCWEGEHLVLVLVAGIPLLILVSIGLPLWLLIVLRYLRGRSNEGISHRAYGFLYKAYNHRCMYWDAVVMLRKGVLATISVFAISLGPNVQGLLSLGVIFIAALSHAWRRPFETEKPRLNAMELVSLISSFLIFFMGILFNDPDVKESDAARTVISVFLTGVLVSTFVYLFAQLCHETRRLMKGKSISDVIGDAVQSGIRKVTKACFVAKQKSINILTRFKILEMRKDIGEL